MTTPLIVALDYSDQQVALALIEQIDPHLCALKVGSEMFTLFGADFIQRLVALGFKVFLDLKFHDIPNTVAQACRAAAELGVWMINVHASGGRDMMAAARASLESYGEKRPLLIGVTVLTSFAEKKLSTIGIECSIEEQVIRLAQLSQASGLDGVVCSAHEVAGIKRTCGANFLTVTPGIRLLGDEIHDQHRIMTPQEAVKLGSDYLVMGRSITKAPHPAKVIHSIVSSLACL